MIERISLRDEYPQISDEKLLNDILNQLREEFLFMPLDDFQIEVHEQDVEPLRKQLDVIKQQLMQGSEKSGDG